MSEVIENLVLEHLNRFHAGHERIERKLDELVQRVGQLEVGMAGVRRDFAHAGETSAGISLRLDRVGERLDRMEKRLDLQG